MQYSGKVWKFPEHTLYAVAMNELKISDREELTIWYNRNGTITDVIFGIPLYCGITIK